MNKYERTPDEVIDLHHHTIAEARVVLDELLRKRGERHVRLIVGKGTHSANGPVLRQFVKTYLTNHGVRYAQSKLKDGGEGALEAFFE